MLKDLFAEQQRNLNAFFDQIDLEEAEKILSAFLECNGMVLFSGIGKSGIIAEKLATTLVSTGTKALYLPPTNALHGDIGIASSQDLFVLMSKSGESQELIDLIPIIRKRGAKVMAWVSNPHSRLAKLADMSITLPYLKELCPFDLAPTTSTAVQLVFGDIIAVALMEKKEFTLDDYAHNHPAGTIGLKTTLKIDDLMLTGDQLPICHPDDTLKDVLVELSQKKSGCLLVVKDGVMEGIFTDGDLRRALQTDSAAVLAKRMGELMQRNFISVNRHQLLLEAMRLMQKDAKKWVMMLPVIESGLLVGLVRMHDMIQVGINS